MQMEGDMKQQCPWIVTDPGDLCMACEKKAVDERNQAACGVLGVLTVTRALTDGAFCGFRRLATVGLCVLAAACVTKPPSSTTPIRPISDPFRDGVYKVGKPYRIAGRLYRPSEDWDYDKVGVASWYGDQFHGRRTANGEIFDKFRMTAAHPTLPLPSRVSVTNLENGRTIEVRVNDRGPFRKQRIIDLSEAAAEALGFRYAGHVEVRVRMLGPAPIGRELRYASNTTDWQRGGSAVVAELIATRGNVPLPAPKPGVVPSQPAWEGARSWQDGAPPTAKPSDFDLNFDRPSDQMLDALPEGRGVFLQAGAYWEERHARAVAQDIGQRGAPAVPDLGRTSISEVTLDERRVYRVRVGPLISLESIRAAAAALRNLGYGDPTVVDDR